MEHCPGSLSKQDHFGIIGINVVLLAEFLHGFLNVLQTILLSRSLGVLKWQPGPFQSPGMGLGSKVVIIPSFYIHSVR